jgi:hypothetical protein
VEEDPVEEDPVELLEPPVDLVDELDESDELELLEVLDELAESPPPLAATDADDPLRESVR